MSMKRVPLPEAEGPRLHPFPTPHGKQPEIEFLQHLGTGGTAHVFKARIDQKIYALKIFLWDFVNKYWARAPEKYLDKVDEKTVIHHMLPFYSECRAYGRLKELNKEYLTARCYGYLFLTAEQEKQLQETFGPLGWKNEETFHERDMNSPLQVLVKEFIPGKVPFEPKHARRMVRYLKHLHRCGILVMDIKEDQYINGILVDLSHARTIPHVTFDPALGFDPYEEGQRAVWSDLGNLDYVFYVWDEEAKNKPKINLRIVPDWQRVASLRNKRESPFANIKDYKFFDPTKFDWRRACGQEGPRRRGRPSPGKPTGVVKRRGKAVKSTQEETSNETRRRKSRRQ